MRQQLEVAWSYRDLMFVVESLIPDHTDPHHLADVLQDDEQLLDAMLEDQRLFQELMAHDEVFLAVSPRFFFRVLLNRARQDLRQRLYTMEQRHFQKVALFDASQVVDLLDRSEVRDYLAAMLASFTRIEGRSIPIQIRPGVWRRIRVNDLDIDSLIRYAQLIDEDERFWVYQRIGDACLLLTGLFPEAIESRQRYPHGDRPAIRLGSSLIHSLEDHESHGKAFYRLAAGHRGAHVSGLDAVLSTLAENFVLLEKPLAWLARHYLSLRKRQLFDV